MIDRRQQDTLEHEEYAADKLSAEMQINFFLFKAEKGMTTVEDIATLKQALRLLGVNV